MTSLPSLAAVGENIINGEVREEAHGDGVL